ncbi:MAG: pyridoxamine 5'-phosphate oxidase [Betaproteobacteria bacterium]|nr:pyridoxamine 5'-phosphate oxidase [Betaproteobacteria bacterium]MDH4293304.1 pyridoxamine 5'-phosphate oxidase [Betaproteobacteria bacterium]MDH5341326.1 pyridoxamine 5'-phosphate oxidase [Betaproteobacteria bacterium]
MSIAALRREYRGESLNESDLAADPFRQFQHWFDEALRAELHTPNAMTLATVGTDSTPSARIVLLKGIDADGFVFYTNYRSRKGLELAANPRAALVFHWSDLEREVRIEGTVDKISAAESDEYFASRPLPSRHAAIASPQSEVVDSRAELEQKFATAIEHHGDAPRRPPHWGGYRLQPVAVEFWQGRPNRLHDRLLYTRDSGRWSIRRLAP